jgi:predicted dehydrogenase
VTLGIGIVGAGRFGAFCLDAFEDLDGATVVAIADVDPARAADVAALAPGRVAVHPDLDALLDDPAVDIVHIGTPPMLHGPFAARAAERGKHVFVEKPLATSRESAVAAVEAADRARVQLSIDYVLRHHPLHRLGLALARSGALGGLQLFALENFASCETLPREHWFWDVTMSGGIHVEHGVHFFDLAIALAGATPSAVWGTQQARPDGAIDRVSALARFGDATAATFHHAFTRTGATERTTIRLAFERGHVTIEGWIPTRLVADAVVDAADAEVLRGLFDGAVDVRPGNGDRVEVLAAAEAPDRSGEYSRAIRAGMADLVAAIHGIRPLQVTAADGLRSLEFALLASR